MKMISDNLVEEIKKRLPEGTNLASTLMDILCLGKESVYRRIRGEVPFTVDELISLAREYNISLDGLMGENFANGAMFNLQFLRDADDLENCRRMLNYNCNVFSYISKDPHSEICSATNSMHFSTYLATDMLCRFKLACHRYHRLGVAPHPSLAQLSVPQDIIELNKRMKEEFYKIGSISLIWDNKMFATLVDEIQYFYGLRILTRTDVESLKDELLGLIDTMEGIAVSGCLPSGKPISIYLSNIHFDAAYIYAERKDFSICFFRVYSLAAFDSQNPEVCGVQKKWMNSLKRHSTLISHSGEIERLRFFADQRSLVQSLIQD